MGLQKMSATALLGDCTPEALLSKVLGRGVEEGRRLVRLRSLKGHQHLHRSPRGCSPEGRLHGGRPLARVVLQQCFLLPHLLDHTRTIRALEP